MEHVLSVISKDPSALTDCQKVQITTFKNVQNAANKILNSQTNVCIRSGDETLSSTSQSEIILSDSVNKENSKFDEGDELFKETDHQPTEGEPSDEDIDNELTQRPTVKSRRKIILSDSEDETVQSCMEDKENEEGKISENTTSPVDTIPFDFINEESNKLEEVELIKETDSQPNKSKVSDEDIDNKVTQRPTVQSKSKRVLSDSEYETMQSSIEDNENKDGKKSGNTISQVDTMPSELINKESSKLDEGELNKETDYQPNKSEVYGDTDDEVTKRLIVKSKKKRVLSNLENDTVQSSVADKRDNSVLSHIDDILFNAPIFNLNSKIVSDVVETTKKGRIGRCITDSDSDGEEVTTPHSFSNDCETQQTYESSSTEKSPDVNKLNGQAKWSTLCDSESSEDEGILRSPGSSPKGSNELAEIDAYLNEEYIKPIEYRRKSKPKNKDEPKKMTCKDADVLNKQIRSESQRMVREMNISLPYHKPKQFTLKEFLSRRPKLSNAVPLEVKASPSVAIKLCSGRLEEISKNLRQREEKVKEFYKSESESDGDESDRDYIPPASVVVAVEEIVENNVDSGINIQQNIGDTPNVSDTDQITIAETVENANQAEPIKCDWDIAPDPPTNHVEQAIATLDYVFNLDDLEENTRENINIVDDNNLVSSSVPMENDVMEDSNRGNCDSVFGVINVASEDVIESTTDSFLDVNKEIENYKPHSNGEDKKTLSKLKLLTDDLANFQPKLSGNPFDVIDLETGSTQPSEIMKLMQRFQQHTAKRQVHRDTIKFSVINTEGSQPLKETVAVNVENEEDTAVEEKPGVRLHRLREELQKQMAAKRAELWQKKAQEKSVEEKEEERSDCGADYGLSDVDDEEEVSQSSEEEVEGEDDEVEEEFVNKEAEESDGEEDDEVVAEEEQEAAESDESSKDENCKKKLRRILKGFTEDSDDDDDNLGDTVNSNPEYSQDDDILPCHQPRAPKTPVSHPSTQTKCDFEFLTPINYLTGIQNLSAAKNQKRSPTISPFRMPSVPSPLKGNEWHSDLQKKLFAEPDITNSQAETMRQFCNTSLSATQEEQDSTTTTDAPSKSLVQDMQSDEVICTAPPTTQDLLAVCSGTFDTPLSTENCSAPLATQDLINICSGKFTGVSQVDTSNLSDTKEIKSLDPEQDVIISQLLDEEEMEKFKKKFESPVMSNRQRRIAEGFELEVTGGGIIDSDEDEEIELKGKKSRRQKIVFSDDEDSDDEDEEQIDLQDDMDEDGEKEEDVSPENVEYDSEENEYEVVNDLKNVKLKANEFFENEAELSESEWESEDEDEKDLDMLEHEKGDEEKFDEKKIRRDLERIHMRKLLDDDTREVKLLQELLLENGELHGSGRQRQFRWRNVDSQMDGESRRQGDDDDVYMEEDESEEQWRRRRYERELFLQKERTRHKAEEEESDSRILRIGHKVLQKMSQGNSQNSENTALDEKAPGSPTLKTNFTLLHKRGSFLNRNDEVLQRLATFNKPTTTLNVGTATARNSKNFLFHSVTVQDDEIVEKLSSKRKASDGTPKIIKKLRLTDNLSPADAKKKSKTPHSKTKLF